MFGVRNRTISTGCQFFEQNPDLPPDERNLQIPRMEAQANHVPVGPYGLPKWMPKKSRPLPPKGAQAVDTGPSVLTGSIREVNQLF
jgi:hypothetical protein